jgi:pimeloyl-ACP methyl ester carboxylesterase
VRIRRRAIVAGVGAAIGVGAGVLYAAERRLVKSWRADESAIARAGLALPATLTHRFVDVSDGGRIHVVESGDGPPIVLLHGVTLSAAIWPRQLRDLSGSHRVVALDLRAHGQSTVGDEELTFDRMGRDVLEVLDELAISGAVLVGHSMGGMIAETLLLNHPDAAGERLAGLVLVATSAGPLVPTRGVGTRAVSFLGGGARRALGYMERHGKGLLPPQDDAAAWVSRASFGANPDPAGIELARSIIGAMSPSAMGEILDPLLSFDVHREISSIDIATRVVVGSRDLLTPPRMARFVARKIPGAQLTVLEGSGHMVMLERPDELNAILDEISLTTV